MVENTSQSDSRVIKDKTQSDSELTSQGNETQGQGQGEILNISLTCPSKYKLGDDRIICNENDSNKDESITPVRGQGQILNRFSLVKLVMMVILVNQVYLMRKILYIVFPLQKTLSLAKMI